MPCQRYGLKGLQVEASGFDLMTLTLGVEHSSHSAIHHSHRYGLMQGGLKKQRSAWL